MKHFQHSENVLCKCNPGFVPSYEVWEGKKTLLRCRDPIKKSKCVGSR